jgi:hypothetical protein
VLFLIALAAIPIDRDLEALPKAPRAALAAAGERIGPRKIVVGGYEFDGSALKAIAANQDEPLLRAVREGLHRPIDLEDFILFLDDICAADDVGRIVITADRARNHGVLLHPADVFTKKKKLYAAKAKTIPIDDPPLQIALVAASDGDPLGPRWAARYQQPESYADRVAELERKNARFGSSMRILIAQLEKQGAAIIVESAVRSRERGYLIYGSFYLSRARSKADLGARIDQLAGYNENWGLAVPILWQHPGGFDATVEAARQMADTYGVDFATVEGAQRSDHYDGKAIDLVAVDLPRALELEAPDGKKRVFDLSAPEQSRDLSLTPELIAWIEQHFGVRKLKSDYPHWKDPN